MPLIGTAGHVDHGKSTLIQALTGRDPDRWEEEKRRGLTIDLGFAWTDLDGQEVSFVDVPGHERYLKNMLAGIEAIDVALFVVAADEGWKPQSEEHLAVLDLLGIDTGVVALTKSDLVDDEHLARTAAEVSKQLEGTTLEAAEIVPVSARTGTGLDHLQSILANLCSGAIATGDRPRLWVDRVFTVSGAGTVVTGSLLDGPVEVGETVEILPGRLVARVRGLQSHDTFVDRAEPGRRVALNLTGIDRHQIQRGSMIGLPGQWLMASRFTARLRHARYLRELPSRGAFHLHFGSGAYLVDVKRTDGDLALLETPSSLPMRTGDRFILRDTGRRMVVAGGVVIDPGPGAAAKCLADAAQVDPTGSRDEIATDLLAVRGIDELARLAAHSGGGRPVDAVVAGGTALTGEHFEALATKLEEAVSAYHEKHPMRPGISPATLATSLDIAPDLVERLIDESPVLTRTGPEVARVDRLLDRETDAGQPWNEAESLLRAGLAVPNVSDLGLDRELLHLLIREKKLVRISDDLVFLPDQVDQISALIRDMEDGFTVAEFRDRSGLSRKFAVPLLEWSDREGLTIRRGDKRHLR